MCTRVPKNRSMTDGDCPTRDDATVILVDSLEMCAFQHNPSSVYITVRACMFWVENNSSPFSRDRYAALYIYIDTVGRVRRVIVNDRCMHKTATREMHYFSLEICRGIYIDAYVHLCDFAGI